MWIPLRSEKVETPLQDRFGDAFIRSGFIKKKPLRTETRRHANRCQKRDDDSTTITKIGKVSVTRHKNKYFTPLFQRFYNPKRHDDR